LTIWQEFAPSDEEIQAYRKEEEWDPEKAKLAAKQKVLVGLGLLCLMPPSAIFQLYRGGQFYLWRKWSTRRKPQTCHKSLTSQVHLSMNRVRVLKYFEMKKLFFLDIK
jgi:hypothetical protein